MTQQLLFRLNPFSPDSPVEPDLFAGRKSELKQIEIALHSTYNHHPQHILIQGERWIGKSSIARYAESLAFMAPTILQVANVNFYISYIRAGSCRNLDELCIAIIDGFKKCQNTAKSRVFDLLSKIKGLQIGPVGIQFDFQNRIDSFVPTFPTLLESILDQTKDYYSSFLIIIDETEQLSTIPGSASFFKTLLEQLNGDGYSNVMFLVTATPDGIDKFTEDHPSFPRLFRYVSLPLMSEEESAELAHKALQRGNPIVAIDDDALRFIYRYSDGFPGLLQELGFVSFEVNTDKKIEIDDVVQGIVGVKGKMKGALETLYDKHFRKTLTADLLSDRYRIILKTIAFDNDEVVAFTTLKNAITPNNEWQLGSYLGNLVKYKVIDRLPGSRGQYKLSSRMLRLWLRLEKIKSKPISKKSKP